MQQSQRALFGAEFARRFARLTRLYWASPDGRRGALLLALSVALELATVYGNFVLADAQRRIYDALQDRAAAAFFAGVALFAGIVLAFVLVSTYRIYVRQALEIRWRTWLTDHLLEDWISPHACSQMEAVRADADNPDQRIAEDVRNYVASALGLSLSLLAALATLVSFAGLLWRMSGDWPIQLGTAHFQIPGFMMWVAFAYAAIASWITHRVGRRLVPINYDRLRFEADFRFGLVRFRENAEAIGLAGGEDFEERSAISRFALIVGNWWELIRAQRNLTLLTTGIGQLNGAVPLLVAAPGYFLGVLTLGAVAQTGIAYGQVSGALAWFVNAYQEIAQWRASIERLLTFIDAMDAARERHGAAAGLCVERGDRDQLAIEDLEIALPDGKPLLEGGSASVSPGERVAVVGPTGAGQTTLFRALAGRWPFGRGQIAMPPPEHTMFVSPQPYLPIAPLRAALTYPAPETTFSDEKIREALQLVGLTNLAGELDTTDHWEKRLSGGEQQRLAIARVLLHEPQWLFLDDATASLDEEAERLMYALLAERLPRSAIVSIAHRPSVARYHTRRWTLVPHPGGPAELKAA
ncbi:MAG: ABC transporter ATP-binding protein/permease [Deltaproteobacteria bacterium]|nr:MAG: ABC transporter ATP-binding protein/permease [Deltaproteobacteria bacterium]